MPVKCSIRVLLLQKGKVDNESALNDVQGNACHRTNSSVCKRGNIVRHDSEQLSIRDSPGISFFEKIKDTWVI